MIRMTNSVISRFEETVPTRKIRLWFKKADGFDEPLKSSSQKQQNKKAIMMTGANSISTERVAKMK